jgi:hypothetical protein
MNEYLLTDSAAKARVAAQTALYRSITCPTCHAAPCSPCAPGSTHGERNDQSTRTLEKELSMTTYPPFVEVSNGYASTSYDLIVLSWGYQVILADACGSYHGDYVYLLGDGDRRGFLIVGYGSCSGCDALEAEEPAGRDTTPEDWQGVVELAQALRESIHWADDAKALAENLRYRLKHGPSTGENWWYFDDEVKSVVKGFIGLLDPDKEN